MKIDNKQNNINFGWNAFTHKAITKKALEDISISNKYKRIIQNYSMAPDFDSTRKLGDTHCYYKSSVDAYKRGKINAKTFYIEYIKKATAAFMEGNKIKAAKFIGRLLHFLQDVALTMHTKPKPKAILEKAVDEKMHRKFETQTLLKQGQYLKNYKKPPVSNKGLIQLFTENVDFSTRSEQVSNNNVSSWGNIAQEGINQATTSSTILLQKMAHFFK